MLRHDKDLHPTRIQLQLKNVPSTPASYTAWAYSYGLNTSHSQAPSKIKQTYPLFILTSFLFYQLQQLSWQSSHEREDAHTLSRKKITPLIIHLAR